MANPTTWIESNQHYLIAALARMRADLEHHASGDKTDTADEAIPPAATTQLSFRGAVLATRNLLRRHEDSSQDRLELAKAEQLPPAVETLCAIFGLSPFERDILLLCAGMELESSFAALCASAQGDASRPYPTFSLALAALRNPHWSALTPTAPLRYWRLIEVGSGSALTTSPLRIDERILNYLVGVNQLDERLAGLIEPVSEMGELAPSHRALAERIAATWSHSRLIQLCGDAASKRAIAATACAVSGLNLSVLSTQSIPLNSSELETLIRLWNREAALSASALLLDGDDVDASDQARDVAITRLIQATQSPVILAMREPRHARRFAMITFDVLKPTTDEQRALWQAALGDAAARLNGQLENLVTQFGLSAPAIQSVTALMEPNADNVGEVLWNACRTQSRPRLSDLAQRIEPAAHWDDLVLPDAQRQTLREIAAHVRQRAQVYERWGFASKGARGLGISALFAGASGTGKTMAAEVLANELRLDLYRIDLSQVVSKYIGETEKNLRRLFDAADEGGAILLFDEADALFGKRSEVKDSHDRYANIEISYLLQRMEAYRGLAILTTNMKSALDTAFLRRIRFIVQFPFPDAVQRAEIWRRIFPTATPRENLDETKLARLNVSGGNIRNIALNAAFLAADEGQPVRMTHLLRAARSEYAKLDKPLTEAEIGGWV